MRFREMSARLACLISDKAVIWKVALMHSHHHLPLAPADFNSIFCASREPAAKSVAPQPLRGVLRVLSTEDLIKHLEHLSTLRTCRPGGGRAIHCFGR